MACSRITAAMAFTAVLFLGMPVADAQAPAVPCNPNAIAVNLTADTAVIHPGATIIYTVVVSNLSAGPLLACHFSDATITVTLPARDGTANGLRVVVVTGYSLPPGTPPTQVGTVPYTVDVEPGVTQVSARVEFSGAFEITAPVRFS